MKTSCMTRGRQQRETGDTMLEPAERARRLTGTAMVSFLTAALFLSVMVDSFVVQTRANSQPRPDRMSSSSSLAAAAAATAARSCGNSNARERGGGQLRRVVDGVRGGESGAGGALSASAVDAAVPGELVDVLGDNAGVLSAEQRTMAATLVQLGQVQQQYSRSPEEGATRWVVFVSSLRSRRGFLARFSWRRCCFSKVG